MNIKKLFPFATLICVILPFYQSAYFSHMTLFLFVFLTIPFLAIALILADQILISADEAEYSPEKLRQLPDKMSHIFLFGMLLPFNAIWENMGLNFEILDIWLISSAVFFVFFDYFYKRIRYWRKIILCWCMLTLLPMCFLHDEAQQTIINNKTLTLAGSLPKEKTSVKDEDGVIEWYFLFNGMAFYCSPKSDKAMDKLLCHDIYQYANQHAQIHYLLENKVIPRIVSVQVGEKTLWSSKDTLALYANHERQIWENFLANLLFMGLPFTLLYFWARKIVVQAA